MNQQENLQERPAERPIEEVFNELEDILSKMQDPQVTLQDSFALYEKGVQDIQLCDELLDRIEKKMQQLNPDGSVQPFDSGEEELPSDGREEELPPDDLDDLPSPYSSEDDWLFS